MRPTRKVSDCASYRTYALPSISGTSSPVGSSRVVCFSLEDEEAVEDEEVPEDEEDAEDVEVPEVISCALTRNTGEVQVIIETDKTIEIKHKNAFSFLFCFPDDGNF